MSCSFLLVQDILLLILKFPINSAGPEHSDFFLTDFWNVLFFSLTQDTLLFIPEILIYSFHPLQDILLISEMSFFILLAQDIFLLISEMPYSFHMSWTLFLIY